MKSLTHSAIWSAIDNLAELTGRSPSGLAKAAGMDPTAFNKSKRTRKDGRARWPSVETIAAVLKVTKTSPSAFFGARL